MSINTSSINSFLINGSGNSLSIINEETSAFSFTDSVVVKIKTIIANNLKLTSTSGAAIALETLNENLVFASSTQALFSLMLVSDNIILNSGLSSKAIFKTITVQSIVFVDTGINILKTSIGDNISFNSNLTGLKQVFETVLSNINTISSTSTKSTFRSTIISSINLIDSFILGGVETVQEQLQLVSSLSVLSTLLEQIAASLIFSSNTNRYVLVSLDINENILLNSTLNSKAIFKQLLNSNITFYLKSSIDNNTYITYSYSPESNTITEYSNYNFIGSARIGSEYLFINKNGLFKYGGKSDNLNPIDVNLITSALNFDTSNLKIVPYLYLGVTLSGNIILKVRVDGKADVTYKLNKFSDSLETMKVEIGKGLVGRYFQFEIITEADDFDMESIEFTPLVIKRKI